MGEPKPAHHTRHRPPAPDGESPWLTLVSAGLFLYVGFGLGLTGVSGNPLYDGSVAALTWGARIVGIGLLVSFGLSYFRTPGAALLDLMLAGLAAGGCLVIGAIWLAFADAQGVLLLLFGLLNASATRAAWARLQWQRRAALRFFQQQCDSQGDDDGRR